MDLDDPKTTVALLKLNDVVGAQGEVRSINGQDRLVRFAHGTERRFELQWLRFQYSP